MTTQFSDTFQKIKTPGCFSYDKSNRVNKPIREQILPGSFVYDIINGKKCSEREKKPFYVQNKKDYLESLQKNCKKLGVPFKKPNVEEIPPYKVKSKPVEHHIEYLDKVVVKLNVLKSGKVRVKILPQMAILNEKYYSNAKIPPIKNVLLALKSVGYSKEYIDNINEKHKKRIKLVENKWIKLEKYFDTPSVNSKSRKKKKEKEEKQDVVEEDEEDILPKSKEDEDDGGMDIEEDNDDENVEEEYISDGGDD